MNLFWLSHNTFLFDFFLEDRAEILTKIPLNFWSIWRHQKDLSKLTHLYQGSLNARLTRSKMAKSSNKWWNILWSFFRLNNLNEHEFPNRPVNKVVLPKYYKNEFNIFVIFGQIGLSGQNWNFLQFLKS